MTKYCFVIDANGKALSPTKENKGWYLIRKNRAKLISKYPMVIQLNRIIPDSDICDDEIRCGIDDGGLHIGIALVQKCRTKNKVFFKGTIENRNDVKHLMQSRKIHRRYRRSHKRYREERYNNRKSSRRKGRIAPSILQKRQAVIRFVNIIRKFIRIDSYWLEDVRIDTRVLVKGYVPYKWQYLKSYRLDENIRKAVIMRDGNRCMQCGKNNVKLEVHHIKPRRLYGTDVLNNLITLCTSCHQQTEGNEEKYMDHFYSLLKTDGYHDIRFASHVMIGKSWLRNELKRLGVLHLTDGGSTANKRYDWGIEKTHSNDAVCITNLRPDTTEIHEWMLKPIRRKSKKKHDSVLEIRHRDYIRYKTRNGIIRYGYVTAIYPQSKLLSFNDGKRDFKKVSANSCKVIWRFTGFYWLDFAA